MTCTPCCAPAAGALLGADAPPGAVSLPHPLLPAVLSLGSAAALLALAGAWVTESAMRGAGIRGRAGAHRPDFGPRTSDFGLRTSDFGPRTGVRWGWGLLVGLAGLATLSLAPQLAGALAAPAYWIAAGALLGASRRTGAGGDWRTPGLGPGPGGRPAAGLPPALGLPGGDPRLGPAPLHGRPELLRRGALPRPPAARPAHQPAGPLLQRGHLLPGAPLHLPHARLAQAGGPPGDPHRLPDRPGQRGLDRRQRGRGEPAPEPLGGAPDRLPAGHRRHLVPQRGRGPAGGGHGDAAGPDGDRPVGRLGAQRSGR